MLKQQQRMVGAMNYNQMMNHVGASARAIGRRINSHYDRSRRGSPQPDALVRTELLRMIATLNAAQDRLIVLYAREAFLQKNGRNSMCAVVQARPPKRGMLYNVSTPPYGGGKLCLTPKGAARIRRGGGGGWKHTATPLNVPCDNPRD